MTMGWALKIGIIMQTHMCPLYLTWIKDQNDTVIHWVHVFSARCVHLIMCLHCLIPRPLPAFHYLQYDMRLCLCVCYVHVCTQQLTHTTINAGVYKLRFPFSISSQTFWRERSQTLMLTSWTAPCWPVQWLPTAPTWWEGAGGVRLPNFTHIYEPSIGWFLVRTSSQCHTGTQL